MCDQVPGVPLMFCFEIWVCVRAEEVIADNVIWFRSVLLHCVSQHATDRLRDFNSQLKFECTPLHEDVSRQKSAHT